MMLKNLSRAQEEGTAFRCISGGCDTWVVMVGQFTTSMPYGNEKIGQAATRPSDRAGGSSSWFRGTARPGAIKRAVMPPLKMAM